MRQLYVASDLHGNNNLMGIIDSEGKRIFKKKLPNDPLLINDILKPFKEEIVGIVVESTYNWYWLVDALMEEGYKVHLAPSRGRVRNGFSFLMHISTRTR